MIPLACVSFLHSSGTPGAIDCVPIPRVPLKMGKRFMLMWQPLVVMFSLIHLSSILGPLSGEEAELQLVETHKSVFEIVNCKSFHIKISRFAQFDEA